MFLPANITIFFENSIYSFYRNKFFTQLSQMGKLKNLKKLEKLEKLKPYALQLNLQPKRLLAIPFNDRRGVITSLTSELAKVL